MVLRQVFTSHAEAKQYADRRNAGAARVGTVDRYEVCDVPLVIDDDVQLVTDDGHKSIDKIYEVISKHA